MKKKKIWKWLILFFCLAALLLCAGCETKDHADPTLTQPATETPTLAPTAPEPAYDFTQKFLRAKEPYGFRFLFDGQVQLTEVGGHTYQFDFSIEADARTAFVDAQEALCAYLLDNGIETEGLVFRILPEYQVRTESDARLVYFGMNSLCTWEQALATIQGALGDYTNYGYLYALANQAAADLDWAQDTTAAENVAVFTENAALLNLVYPCYTEVYTEASDIAACKALARKLLEEQEDPFDGEAFLAARETYAQQHKIIFTPTYLRFAYNSDSCPLKFLTNYMEVFRDSTYEAGYFYQEELLETDYFDNTALLIEAFTDLDADLESLYTLFDAERQEIIPVQMMETLPWCSPMNVIAYYYDDWRDDTKHIYSRSVTALKHEYIHYLYTFCGDETDPEFEVWQDECLAYYYSADVDYELMQCEIAQGGRRYKRNIESIIGQEFDEVSDYILLMKCLLEMDDMTPQYHLKTANDGCSVFADYFIKKYGEEAFFRCMLQPSETKALTGLYMNEIVDIWSDSIQNRG